MSSNTIILVSDTYRTKNNHKGSPFYRENGLLLLLSK